MKKFWNKYKSTIIAVVSYLVGFNIGEVIKDNGRAEEPVPVVLEQSAQGESQPAALPADGGAAASSVPPAPSFDYSSLDWCWGGFNGAKAQPVEGVKIGSLKVSGDGLSYKWVSGGCEWLGASSRTDANCLACLFCKVDGKWRGGKFDWISSSRLTRGFENIRDGYNGWNPGALSAREYAFVIVSKDGKRRSNVALFSK